MTPDKSERTALVSLPAEAGRPARKAGLFRPASSRVQRTRPTLTGSHASLFPASSSVNVASRSLQVASGFSRKLGVASGFSRRIRARLLTWALCLGTCALSLGVATPVRATVIAPAEFPDVVNGSQLIVHGRVVDVRSQMTAGRRSIHSFVTVAVDQALKGNPGAAVTFRVPQGQVGRYRRIVVGAPEFSVGEEVLVFLTGRGPAIPTVYGLNQGVRRLRGDAANRRFMLDGYTRQVRAIVERTR